MKCPPLPGPGSEGSVVFEIVELIHAADNKRAQILFVFSLAIERTTATATTLISSIPRQNCG